MTTNHIDCLDPAPSRPGSIDVWVNSPTLPNGKQRAFSNVYSLFGPQRYLPSSSSSLLDDDASTACDALQKYLPGSRRKASAHAVPVLEEVKITELAKRFADTIPEGEMSV